jgi:RNA-directed DNA polymerase
VIDESLERPDKVRELQIKLYRKAKNEPGFGFYQLCDKVYREDIVLRAWADLEPNAYGYRPRRSAQDAIRKVDELLYQGYTDIVDADLSKYFDTIPHSELLQCVARRVVDKHMLHLLKMWLKVPVEERDEKGKKRLTGGKDQDRGAPQGGVISPLPANLYLNRMWKGWRQTGRGEQYRARIVNYADDFVILSRGKAKEALEWTRGVLAWLSLTLTSVGERGGSI